jgi:hypothetical protein
VIKKLKLGKMLYGVSLAALMSMSCLASEVIEEDRVTGLYYKGTSYQDATSHLPKSYVKDAMDDPLKAALQGVIDESYTRVVQPSFNGSKVFSLNQHRRVFSPLFYLVRRECEATNNAENLHKSIMHHMRTVWKQDEVKLPVSDRDIDVFFQNMMPYTIKFLDIGREQRAPAARGARGLIEDNLKQVLLKISVNFDPHSETSLEALYNSEYKANLYVQTNGFRKSYEINKHTLFPLSIEVPLEGSLESLSFNTWTSSNMVESIGRAIIDNSTELENRGRCFKNIEVKLSLGSSFLRVVDGHVIKKGSNQERPFSTTCVVENYEEV